MNDHREGEGPQTAADYAPDVQDGMDLTGGAEFTEQDWQATLMASELLREDAEAALAAVTAERDRERAQHEATKSTLDQAWADLHAEKQMREETRVLLDQALTERDQARQMLAFDWGRDASPDKVDLVAAYQAWLDWYNADKQDEEDARSHELAREYVLILITELRQARQAFPAANSSDAKSMELLWQQEVRNHDATRQMLADAPHEPSCASLWRYPDHHVEPCDCWKAGL